MKYVGVDTALTRHPTPEAAAVSASQRAAAGGW